MNKIIILLSAIVFFAACSKKNNTIKRIPVAEVGKVILYYDEMPQLIQHGVNGSGMDPRFYCFAHAKHSAMGAKQLFHSFNSS